MSEATSIVIFGASGDLARRKLLPALYNLYMKGRLTGPLNIVGISRTPFSHTEWRERLSAGVLEHSPLTWERARWDEFARHIWYVPGNAGEREDMTRLNNFLAEREQGASRRLYYLSVAPPLYVPIVHNLGALGMHLAEQGWRRAIFEKPFGTDLDSARALNREIHSYFAENQVYRIDHYLGKETIQNIIFLRFANAIFEPLWNREHIENVQISALEAVDVGTRGGYYDDFGVFRDMFQNHMLQMMMLTAIEPPDHVDADLIRDEKVRLLHAVRPIASEDIVSGQYEGYNPADGSDGTVRTATYAALRLWVDNERWRGVPFYLRSGKALSRKRTDIIINFRRPPQRMPGERQSIPNALSICLQPDEGVQLAIDAKVPDTASETRRVHMGFRYDHAFAATPIPEAYERLLHDAMQGDASMFARSDGIEAAWQLIDPVIHDGEKRAPLLYEAGGQGPAAAAALLAEAGHSWADGCGRD